MGIIKDLSISDSQGDEELFVEDDKYVIKEIRNCRKALGDDHPEVIIAINQIGNAYKKNHQYDLAEKCYNESLNILRKEKRESKRELASLLVVIGEVYLEQRHFSKSLDAFNEAYDVLELQEDDKSEIALPDILLHIGQVYEETNSLQQSLKYYEDSFELSHGILGDGHPFLAKILNCIGRNLVKQKNYTEANYMFSKALQIQKVAYGSKNIELTETMDNLAEVQDLQNSPIVAIDIYNKVLLLKTKYYGRIDHRLVDTLANIGRTERNQGNVDEAMKYYEEAKKLTKEFLGEWHMKYGECLTDIGVLQRRTGDYDASLKTLKQARKVFCEYNLPTNHTSFERVSRHIQEISYVETEILSSQKLNRKVAFRDSETLPSLDQKRRGKSLIKKKKTYNKIGKDLRSDSIKLFDSLDDIVD